MYTLSSIAINGTEYEVVDCAAREISGSKHYILSDNFLVEIGSDINIAPTLNGERCLLCGTRGSNYISGLVDMQHNLLSKNGSIRIYELTGMYNDIGMVHNVNSIDFRGYQPVVFYGYNLSKSIRGIYAINR